MKKGVTLIELVVAMGIFSIIATLVVGAFVLILNMKSLTSNMRESQQKLRMAIELTSRLSRQAEVAMVSSGNKTLTLYQGGETPSATRFIIDANGSLYQEDCLTVDSSAEDCTTTGWSNHKIDLLGGNILLDSSSNFAKNGAKPATLDINLIGVIPGTKAFNSDRLTINNTVVLESLK